MDTNINDLMIQGQGLYASGNRADAIRYFEMAAQMGNENAKMITAICYFNGDGVGKSYYKVVECIKDIAEKGNVDAEFLMAECYHMEDSPIKNEVEAYRWYDKAASHGHLEAQSKKREIELSKDKSNL